MNPQGNAEEVEAKSVPWVTIFKTYDKSMTWGLWVKVSLSDSQRNDRFERRGGN